MLEKLNYILILALISVSISCKNEKKNNILNLETGTELKSDSVETYNELANTEKRKTLEISEYNTDNSETENIKRPEKTIIRNLEIDTTKAFGIWTQDPNGPHADFWLTKKSFYVVDYDGDGAMPYILDKNKITVFYNDFIQKGTITSTENDILKIKWSDMDKETEYVKFEN
ncbi:hypothetical protein HNV10_16600 [Winogradskyella litoriviva]|uniref:Lipoprotein n=1 Tax=Winogradskyella litoriviva TaxID=1220182 RepID=A0ABX2EA39_9FLAO|nr:hypothetical protein [Winogradskyella litoriviva]NRD24876.1 hypothetical protein [Winogradskyella litoriviva]